MNKYTDSNAMSWYGTLTAFIGGVYGKLQELSLGDWGVLCSILFGLMTVLINWRSKAREAELREMELKLKYKLEKLPDEQEE